MSSTQRRWSALCHLPRVRQQPNQASIPPARKSRRVTRRPSMAHDIARDVPVPGRDAVPALLRPAKNDCGIILMHGSAGDMNSGRLPMYTDALAGAGFPVLRFTIKPPHMPTRVKCCQVRTHTPALLSEVIRWGRY